MAISDLGRELKTRSKVEKSQKNTSYGACSLCLAQPDLFYAIQDHQLRVGAIPV